MSYVKTSLLLLVVSLSATPTLESGFWSTQETKATGCNITLTSDVPSPSPLLLKSCFNRCNVTKTFQPPSSLSVVTLATGQRLSLACPGSDNFLTILGQAVHLVEAVCKAGSLYTVEGRPFHLYFLHCEKSPIQVARSNGRCNNNASSSLEVGFQVGTYGLAKTMDICFDMNTKNTLWSSFELVSEVLWGQKGNPRPSFVADTFYPGLKPDNLYNVEVQRKTISKALGSDELGLKYVPLKGSFFLSKGHLTANADFVYYTQRETTFRYVNVAPQWQTLNGGNWNTMENNLRDRVSAMGWNLIVYTGTYGVMTLPDANDIEKEIWLSVDENNNYEIPAPYAFWKVAYDPNSSLAVALVSVNNPYLDVKTAICPELACASWLTWKAANQTLGYSYCCAVDAAFRSVVPSLPEFKVVGVLK